MALAIEEKAYLAREWSRGVPQPRLAERYGLCTSAVNIAVVEFLLRALPEVETRGECDYLTVKVQGRARQVLAGQAVLGWVGFREPTRVIPRRKVRRWDGPQRSRPLDMGGPRDEWLEFGVPVDPRDDNLLSRG